VIRGAQPLSFKDDVPALGLHFRFEKVDPATGQMTISAALASGEQRSIPIDVAENAARSDYIVLEAIIFPGINLVWIGSILMLVGLALGLWRRAKEV
jgi:cytochrome c-type biogenesis protein CcmF